MADTVYSTRRGATFTLVSGDGTPKTYAINIGEGSCAVTNGGRTTVQPKDTNGDFTGTPRMGEQAGPSMIAIQARIFDAGAKTTEAVLADLIRQGGDLGYVASDWASTDTDSDLQVYSFKISLPNVGSTKGGVYTWTGCTIEPGVQIEHRPDGHFASFSLRSGLPEPTFTRNV